MKSTNTPGMNRTGMALSPALAEEMMELEDLTTPSSMGEPADVLSVRAEYAETAEPHGTVPPPATLKQAVSSVVKALKGEKATALIDKLGERLAFERTGTRLYEGLLLKYDVHGSWPGGPKRGELEKIHQDELQHFLLLRDVMAALGADPTAITPSANISAVASMGLLQVISDPRTNLMESMEAIAIAELADNDCWGNLVELVRASGYDDIADRFELALAEEQEHLANVRTWLSAGLASRSALPLARPKVRAQLAEAQRPPSAHRTKRPGGTRSKTARRVTAAAKTTRGERTHAPTKTASKSPSRPSSKSRSATGRSKTTPRGKSPSRGGNGSRRTRT